jgi:hypothetical protein
MGTRMAISGVTPRDRRSPFGRTSRAFTSLELDREAGGVAAALDRLDRALDRSPLYERDRQKLAAREPR